MSFSAAYSLWYSIRGWKETRNLLRRVALAVSTERSVSSTRGHQSTNDPNGGTVLVKASLGSTQLNGDLHALSLGRDPGLDLNFE